MSQEQLNAACDEAKKQGPRTLVHAFRDAVATNAGCTEVEHGLGASDDDLRLMAEQGTYLDPQAGLLLATYLQNKDRYLAAPYYTEEGFAAMKGLIVAPQEFMPAQKTTDAQLGIRLRSDKDSYSLRGDIHLEIIRENTGAEQLLVCRQWVWGIARTEVHVFDATGTEVHTDFMADELPPPPQPYAFVLLSSGDFGWNAFGRTRKTLRHQTRRLGVCHQVHERLVRELCTRSDENAERPVLVT